MKKRDVIGVHDAHREQFDRFADLVGGIERREGWRAYDVLSAFLESGYRALAGRFMIGDALAKNESEYMAVVRRCQSPKETMSDISTMLGCTWQALINHPSDFIGPTFTCVAANERTGQFFTPREVSRAMAEMIIGDRDALRTLVDRVGHVSCLEPAAGVGGMILEANQVLRERGLDLVREVHWTAVDVDFKAFCGCYIQLALTDASADVVFGNSLSAETWTSTATPAAIMYPKARVRAVRQPVTQVESMPVAAAPRFQLELPI